MILDRFQSQLSAIQSQIEEDKRMSSHLLVSGTQLQKSPRYTTGEEIANAVTHGVAALMSVAGLAILVGFAVAYSGTPMVITAVSVFGASMVFLYVASTLYYAIPNPKAKRILQRLDHSMIFVLIAGSYTPFCLITLKGVTGIALCIAVWTIAILGITLQGFLIKKGKWLNSLLYLAMGWLVILVIEPLIENLPNGGLWLLTAGGLSYSLGVIFYIWKSMPYNHAIWHLFVFAGTVLQFLSVLLYVIPVFR